MLIKELKKLKAKEELVTIIRTCDGEGLTGCLTQVNENYVAMHLYNDDGKYDGFTIFETYQIEEVLWGNREHKAIDYLINKGEPIITPRLKTRAFQNAILEVSKKYGCLMLYKSYTDDMFDIVDILGHDDDWLKVQTYGTKQSLSRMTKLIERYDICRVTVNSAYQKDIVNLHSVKELIDFDVGATQASQDLGQAVKK